MYVTMKDNFMSGWGQADGLVNIYLVECDSSDQQEQVFSHANDRDEMSLVKMCAAKPYYRPSTHLVTEKHYSDLGGCWIEDGGRLR